MASIGSIAISLKARTQKFNSDMKKSGLSVKSFASAAASAAKGVALFGTAVAAAGTAVAVGIAALVKTEMKAIDQTAKFADRLGMTTEGLTGLMHAADLSGVKMEALKMGLQRMTRRVNEASHGTGEAQKALKELGLEAKDLAQIKPEDQFLKIADAMQGAATQGDRVRLAMRLFDSEGVSFVQIMQNGSAAIRDQMAAGKALGLTYTRDMARSVEVANNALLASRSIVKGMTTTLAIELAPVIAAGANAFVEWAQQGEGASKKVLEAVGWVTEAVGTTLDIFQALKASATLVGSVITGAFGAGTVASGYLIQALEKIVEVMSFGAIASDFGKTIVAFGKDVLAGSLEAFRDASHEIHDAWDGGNSKRFVAALNEIKRAAGEAAKATGEVKLPNRRGAAAGDARGRDSAASGGPSYDAAPFRKMVEEIKKEVIERERALRYTEDQVEAEDELLRIMKLRVQGEGKLADQLEDILEKEEERAKLVKQAAADAKREESIQSQQKAELRRIQDLKKSRAEERRGYERELEIMKAGNETAKERLRIQNELADIVAKLGNDQKTIAAAEALAAEKLAELAEREAKAAAEKAKQAKEAAAASITQANTIKKMADITKRFANFGGTSMFGFGAGQAGTGLGSMNTKTTVKKPQPKAPKSSPQEKVVAQAVKQAAANIKSLSPAMKSARATVKKIEPMWKALGKEITAFAADMKSMIDRMMVATEQSVQSLGSAVSELRSKLNAFETRLARAASLGVGGS